MRRLLKLFLRISIILLVVFISLVLASRIPAVQTWVAQKVVSYVSQNYALALSIENIHLNLPKRISLEKLFLPDNQSDTLVYLDELEVNISVLNLFSNQIIIDDIELHGGHVRIIQQADGANYDHLIKAFSGDTLSEKEQSEGNFELGLKRVSLENTKVLLDFQDNGVKLEVEEKLIEVNLKTFNLDSYTFIAKSINLENASVNLLLTASDTLNVSLPTAQTTTTTMPHVGADKITLKDVSFEMSHPATKISMQLSEGLIKPKSVDLDQMIFLAKEIDLNELDFALEYVTDTTTAEDTIIEASEPDITYIISDIGVAAGADHISVSDADFALDASIIIPSPSGIDYAHMHFSQLALNVDNAYYSDTLIGAFINDASFKEQSGLELKELHTTVAMKPQSIVISELTLHTSNNLISTKGLKLKYPHLLKLDTEYSSMEVEGDLSQGGRLLQDLNLLLPLDQYLGELNELEILETKIKADVNGSLKAMQVNDLQLSRSQLFNLEYRGQFNFQEEDTVLNYNIDTMHLEVRNAQKLLNLISDSLDFVMPDTLSLGASGSGDLKHANIDLAIYSNIGNGEVMLRSDDFNDEASFKIALYDVVLASLLGIEKWGTTSVELEGQIKNAFEEYRSIDAKVYVPYTTWDERTLHDIRLAISGTESTLQGRLDVHDTLIQMTADLEVNLFEDSVNGVANIDLEKLNLDIILPEKENNLVKGKFDFSLFANADNWGLNMNASELYVENDVAMASIEDIEMRIHDNALTHMLVVSGDNRMEYYSNIPPSNLTKLFYNPQLTDSVSDFSPQDTLHFSISLPKTNNLFELFAPKITQFELDEFQATYSGGSRKLLCDLDISALKGGQLSASDIEVSLLSEEGRPRSIQLHLARLGYDSLYMLPLKFDLINSEGIQYNIQLGEEGEQPEYQSTGTIDYLNSEFHITPSGETILLGEKIHTEVDTVGGLKLVWRLGNRSLCVVNKDGKLDVILNQFPIQYLTGLLRTDHYRHIVKGVLNGQVSVSPSSIKSNMYLDSTEVFDFHTGDVQFSLLPIDSLNYKGETIIKSTSNIIKINGTFNKNEELSLEKLQGEFHIEDFKLLSIFYNDYLDIPSGILDGHLSYKNQSMDGEINFKEMSIFVPYLNTNYSLKDEKLTMSKQHLVFKDFKITDSQGVPLAINGNIVLPKDYDLLKVRTNLDIKAQNFALVYSEGDPKAQIQGSLFISIDGSARGEVDDPVLNAKVDVGGQTALTYMLPGSELELIEGGNVVVFTDPSMSDSVIYKSQYADSIAQTSFRYNVKADINIDPEAAVTVIVDPSSGDMMTFKGKGSLKYSVTDHSIQRLDGLYEFVSGNYQMNFYGLIKKEFEIVPGSVVNWNGNILDASASISAKHIVRTASLPLISNEVAGISDYDRSVFNQRLPYEVFFNIKGVISEPTIDFALSLPERYLFNYPIIASKIQQMNSPGGEEELNKQVFALLVMGAFIAENPDVAQGNSSAHFASTAARNSLNGILTQQLNNITGQYIKGIDINLGVNTFEDYSQGQSGNRTELDIQVSKRMFNDRVTVELESKVNLEGGNNNMSDSKSAGVTEFAVFYDLTESGAYRIKAFRESAFDLFDGEIYNSGIAFIFTKELEDKPHKKVQKQDTLRSE